METTIKTYTENKYTEVNVTVQIPFCNKRGSDSDIDLNEILRKEEARNWDLLGTFSERIIGSLERRMHACQENLIRHLDTVVYSDEAGCILYRRKDGSEGKFNTYSFNAMKDCVKALKQSCWRSVLENSFWVDQILKSLLNDTEMDHSDEGPLKWSDLISLLCEVHLIGLPSGTHESSM